MKAIGPASGERSADTVMQPESITPQPRHKGRIIVRFVSSLEMGSPAANNPSVQFPNCHRTETDAPGFL
jgi:hypothetical protein